MRVVVMIDSVVRVDGDGVGKMVGMVVTMAGCGGAVAAHGGACWWGSDRSVGEKHFWTRSENSPEKWRRRNTRRKVTGQISGSSDWWWPEKLAGDGDRETFLTATADGRNTSPAAAAGSSIEREGEKILFIVCVSLRVVNE
ncbi:hypothetical protein Tco_1272577 [Tanacetum coccineum]